MMKVAALMIIVGIACGSVITWILFVNQPQTASTIKSKPVVGVQPVPTIPVDLGTEIDLIVLNPVEGEIVDRPNYIVRGSTLPRVQVAVNEKETIANAKGDFTVAVVLDEGENLIDVVVNDLDGNMSEKLITVVYEP